MAAFNVEVKIIKGNNFLSTPNGVCIFLLFVYYSKYYMKEGCPSYIILFNVNTLKLEMLNVFLSKKKILQVLCYIHIYTTQKPPEE